MRLIVKGVFATEEYIKYLEEEEGKEEYLKSPFIGDKEIKSLLCLDLDKYFKDQKADFTMSQENINYTVLYGEENVYTLDISFDKLAHIIADQYDIKVIKHI